MHEGRCPFHCLGLISWALNSELQPLDSEVRLSLASKRGHRTHVSAHRLQRELHTSPPPEQPPPMRRVCPDHSPEAVICFSTSHFHSKSSMCTPWKIKFSLCFVHTQSVSEQRLSCRAECGKHRNQVWAVTAPSGDRPAAATPRGPAPTFLKRASRLLPNPPVSPRHTQGPPGETR